MRLRGEGGERTGDNLACAWPRRRRFGSIVLATPVLAQVSPPSRAAADAAFDIPAGDLSLANQQAVAPSPAGTSLAMESSRSALPTMRHRS